MKRLNVPYVDSVSVKLRNEPFEEDNTQCYLWASVQTKQLSIGLYSFLEPLFNVLDQFEERGGGGLSFLQTLIRQSGSDWPVSAHPV